MSFVKNRSAAVCSALLEVMIDDVPATDDDALTTLVEGARAGDAAAVEELFLALNPRLLRYLVAQEPRVADDIAGQVWLAVAERIGRFVGDGSDFRAWFFTIARHRLADHRRTAARRRTDVVDSVELDGPSHEVDLESRAIGVLSGQEAARLIAATLSTEQAEVLILRTIADLDVEQVATIMARSPNWVRVTQHRAVRNLARRLGSRLSVIR